ncbi:MAG: SAM-dependent methyltransferase [Planctomycetaceae bacterium]|nr:SAM-dependent methyltransferase [Planctomycetaceae bacterium]
MSDMQPFFEDVQTIYDDDHSTQFVDLFLDPSMTYSCAYYKDDDYSLEQAQLAKIDLALDKCDLSPGQTLLDIGCGWGACAYRAASERGVNVIGLTLSAGQKAFCERRMQSLPAGSGTVEIRLAGWEQFDEPVDRIVSVGAFEHFRVERHAEFFRRCRSVLPDDGVMLLHTIVSYDLADLDERGIPFDHEDVLFHKFIAKEIFPGGQLTPPRFIVQFAEDAGFEVTRQHSLQLHYARTLETWATALEANRDEAIRRKSQADFDRFMKYLTGCAARFRSGHIDLFQFTCQAK